jgi:hypothetical protein
MDSGWCCTWIDSLFAVLGMASIVLWSKTILAQPVGCIAGLSVEKYEYLNKSIR